MHDHDEVVCIGYSTLTGSHRTRNLSLANYATLDLRRMHLILRNGYVLIRKVQVIIIILGHDKIYPLSCVTSYHRTPLRSDLLLSLSPSHLRLGLDLDLDQGWSIRS
jgi:hypothetical protein